MHAFYYHLGGNSKWIGCPYYQRTRRKKEEESLSQRHKYCANGVVNSTPETSFPRICDVTRHESDGVHNNRPTTTQLSTSTSRRRRSKLFNGSGNVMSLKTVDPQTQTPRRTMRCKWIFWTRTRQFTWVTDFC